MSRHGGKKYCIFGKPCTEDDKFIQAAALVREFLMGNVTKNGPSLPLWVAFVSGAPR